MKIGIMGGTFNPIHNAHLLIAEMAREEYGLDRVIFITDGNPPHKSANVTAKQRFEMTHIAIADNSAFEEDDFEINRSEKSYTVNTLETEEIGCTVRLPQFVYAPIKKGEVLGTAVYTLNGDIIGTADICAPKSIAVINAAPNKGAVFLRNLKYILLNI